MPIYPADPNLQALLNRPLEQPGIGGVFDTLLKLRMGEQQQAMQVFETLARANPTLASFVGTQTNLPKTLTSTPSTVRKKGEADMGTQVQQAFLAAAKATADTSGTLAISPEKMVDVYKKVTELVPPNVLAGPDGQKAFALGVEAFTSTDPARGAQAAQALAQLAGFEPDVVKNKMALADYYFANRDLFNQSPLAQQHNVKITSMGDAIAVAAFGPPDLLDQTKADIADLRVRMAELKLKEMEAKGEYDVATVLDLENDAQRIRDEIAASKKQLTEIEKANAESNIDMIASTLGQEGAQLKASRAAQKSAIEESIRANEARLGAYTDIITKARKGTIKKNEPAASAMGTSTSAEDDALVNSILN